MSELGSAAVGSAVSGGLGIIGSLVSYGMNKKLAEQQNQYNLDMWKMQADYNSPQAQMQRFREAGLNPNLIYGQGNNGNMSSAPELVTPHAPELSRDMQELGKAFNIENLRTLIARRKEAQANADNARTNATRNERELFSEEVLGNLYEFNPNTGQFVERPKLKYGEVRSVHPSAWYTNKRLAQMYLIPFRGAYLDYQKRYLAPQVQMANYEASHYPVSFWIGQGSKALQGVGSMVGMFNPKNWFMNLGKSGGAYRAPGGKIYYY